MAGLHQAEGLCLKIKQALACCLPRAQGPEPGLLPRFLWSSTLRAGHRTFLPDPSLPAAFHCHHPVSPGGLQSSAQTRSPTPGPTGGRQEEAAAAARVPTLTSPERCALHSDARWGLRDQADTDRHLGNLGLFLDGQNYR